MAFSSACRAAILSPKLWLTGLGLTLELTSLPTALRLPLLNLFILWIMCPRRRLELRLAHRSLLDSSSDSEVLEVLELPDLLVEVPRALLHFRCLLLRVRRASRRLLSSLLSS